MQTSCIGQKIPQYSKVLGVTPSFGVQPESWFWGQGERPEIDWLLAPAPVANSEVCDEEADHCNRSQEGFAGLQISGKRLSTLRGRRKIPSGCSPNPRRPSSTSIPTSIGRQQTSPPALARPRKEKPTQVLSRKVESVSLDLSSNSFSLRRSRFEWPAPECCCLSRQG